MNTQRLVASYWDDVFPFATPRGAGEQGADLLWTGRVAFEIKARRDFYPLAWMRQARDNAAGELAVVVMRPDGAGEVSLPDWPFIVRQADAKMLIEKAGYYK